MSATHLERNKDDQWLDLPNTWGNVHVRVLQDIRDELKKLNNLLSCRNFIMFPQYLRDIRRNTMRKRKAKITVTRKTK